MIRKLNCIGLDDNKMSLDVLDTLCQESRYVHSVKLYDNPKKFLEEARSMQYDLLIADIFMPEIDGITVAKMQKEPVIFITAEEGILRCALDVSPVDVLVKPLLQERFDKAMAKAQMLLKDKHQPKTHSSFSVSELNERVSINLSDILLVTSDERDSRNKVAYLKGDIKYTLMDCTFDSLLRIMPELVKVNRTHVISLAAVKSYKYDLITISGVRANQKVLQITLSDTCRKEFMRRMESF